MSLPSSTWTLIPDTALTSVQAATAANFTPGVDFLLDADGDLDLSLGDLRFTTGLEAVAQGIYIALHVFRGEWFLDREYGIPYLANDIVSEAEAILGGKFNAATAAAYFRRAIAAVAGVLEIRSLSVDFAGGTRTLSVRFNVRAETGTIIVTEVI